MNDFDKEFESIVHDLCGDEFQVKIQPSKEDYSLKEIKDFFEWFTHRVSIIPYELLNDYFGYFFNNPREREEKMKCSCGQEHKVEFEPDFLPSRFIEFELETYNKNNKIRYDDIFCPNCGRRLSVLGIIKKLTYERK